MYEINSSNGFFTKEVMSGGKGFSEKISLKKSLKDCLTVIMKKGSVIKAVLIISQPLSLQSKSCKFHCLMLYWEFL